jgi:RNA polymerase sigma-70 factor (ECF subfamily)
MTTDPFVTHRNLPLYGRYEMHRLRYGCRGRGAGDVAAVAEVDQAGVGSPRAYLVQMVTRQSLNRLRTLSRRREDYVGEWLPEPLLTSPDVADDIELAESVSIAMLTVLETLGPPKRAVFVLREVFDTPYDEIAVTVGKTTPPRSARSRAALVSHVAARRPRVQVTPAEQQAVVTQFLHALSTGNVQELMQVLAPDVVAIADGGGVMPAARRPIVGAAKLAAFLPLLAQAQGFMATTIWLNGMPGIRIDVAAGTTAISLVVADGHITHIHAVNNPHKLGHLDHIVDLRR